MAERELPSGTVSFLFTDIEGSTRLLHELGAERYAAALVEHRHVVRGAFACHGGVEVDSQGDAFFVAFATASGALEAAWAAQSALSLPVRMGIHTGTPRLTAEGYVGTDVHRAARIAAAGHGGQVLVSASTATLAGTALRDLGEHRLKDLSAPERIFQLGDGDFPSLKTLYRTNLPVPATPFLGRAQELAIVGELLAREDMRLLTLTGAGGSGKTRLALQAAGAAGEAYPQGVWWVPLAPVSTAGEVASAAARVLGGGGSLPEVVAERRLLLVLDNFEHVIGAAAEVADLLLLGCGLGLRGSRMPSCPAGARREPGWFLRLAVFRAPSAGARRLGAARVGWPLRVVLSGTAAAGRLMLPAATANGWHRLVGDHAPGAFDRPLSGGRRRHRLLP